MAKLSSQYLKGLETFLYHISKEKSVLWFGPWSRLDSSKQKFLVEREWEAMNEIERAPFYLEGLNENSIKTKWSKPLSIEDVLQKRHVLHQSYTPKDLHYLEFMLKTKPRRPFGTKYWFNRLLEMDIKIKGGSGSPKLEDPTTLRILEGWVCLDKRRYTFEKNAWFAKLIQIDPTSDSFRLGDFESEEIRECQKRFEEAIKSCDKPGPITIKRPRGPFSLWIEDYRYMIRDEKPEFQFGKHLRMCSESWSQLSSEKKEELKKRSIKLKEDYMAKRAMYDEKFNNEESERVYADLFKHGKSEYPNHPSQLVPNVPSAIELFATKRKICDKKIATREWNLLGESEQKQYLDERDQLKSQQEIKRDEIRAKVKDTKEMLRKALELARLKKKLGLGCRSKEEIHHDQG